MFPVTIIIVPRERFSCTKTSLESIKLHTQYPHQIVYIDGNSPQHVKEYLISQAQELDFKLLRFEQYLYPNQAKNIGLKYLKSSGCQSKYIVFVDNDIIVAPNWLQALVKCADETQAAVVTPLICDSQPLHQKVHMAGGSCYIWEDAEGKRHLWSEMYYRGKQKRSIQQDLLRRPTSLVEFHCLLINRDWLNQVGQFDPQMYSTREHVDFCLSVIRAKKKIYFEPTSIVTYLPDFPQDEWDLLFYTLRWSNIWKIKSLHRLRDKWQLHEDQYFLNFYHNLGAQRQKYLLPALISNLATQLEQSKLEKHQIIKNIACWEMKQNDIITRNNRDQMYVELNQLTL